ncbi:MAG: tyrosine-type recombinase/integrase [Candidatus Sumerlaeota bacterium]|nr:tyrosine-type recombinase/integrase [Candidatus Sumerlaeota bacterium]
MGLPNLLVRTGLRTIEAIRADVGDIRQESGEWVLRVQGKGRDAKDEFVLLTIDAFKPLLEYLVLRRNPPLDAPLFAATSNRCVNARLTTRSVRGIVKAHLRRYGFDSDRLSCHSLRHTFATLALKGGAPLEQVQAACRHASIQTTMVYAHNLDRVANGAERYVEI